MGKVRSIVQAWGRLGIEEQTGKRIQKVGEWLRKVEEWLRKNGTKKNRMRKG